MLTGIDISNWQRGFSVTNSNLDFVIVKATEGTSYVDKSCNGFVQQAITSGIPFGFYHFARKNNATQEADFFIKNTLGYFGKGIPILDWEDGQSVAWVNEFVRRVHSVKGVWPWIYANPWRFNQGDVDPNCMRWVAQYPNVKHPTFAQAKGWTPPKTQGGVGAWQFCSDGRLNGYSGNLDCDLFYGDKEAWAKYVGASATAPQPSPTAPTASTLENDQYRVTIEKK